MRAVTTAPPTASFRCGASARSRPHSSATWAPNRTAVAPPGPALHREYGRTQREDERPPRRRRKRRAVLPLPSGGRFGGGFAGLASTPPAGGCEASSGDGEASSGDFEASSGDGGAATAGLSAPPPSGSASAGSSGSGSALRDGVAGATVASGDSSLRRGPERSLRSTPAAPEAPDSARGGGGGPRNDLRRVRNAATPTMRPTIATASNATPVAGVGFASQLPNR